MDYYRTKITEVSSLAQGYFLLRFEGDEPVCGKPGQFVMVRGEWGTDPVLPRAFSIVSVGQSGGILVRVVGKGTKLLSKMKKDDPLWVLGPIGRGFPDPEVGTRPVLVAGGVGVAPLVFLAENLPSNGTRPICIYGARTSQDLPLCDRLGELCDLVVTTEDGSVGRKGLVTDPLKQVLEGTESVHLFSCGPNPMLKAVGEIAIAAKVPCHVALEAPMACGKGTCKGCAVPVPGGGYVYVCSDGPVFAAQEIYGGEK